MVLPPSLSSFIGRTLAQIGNPRVSQKGAGFPLPALACPLGPSQDAAGAGDGPTLLELLLELLLLHRQHLHLLLQLAQLRCPLLRGHCRNGYLS